MHTFYYHRAWVPNQRPLDQRSPTGGPWAANCWSAKPRRFRRSKDLWILLYIDFLDILHSDFSKKSTAAPSKHLKIYFRVVFLTFFALVSQSRLRRFQRIRFLVDVLLFV
uniref:Uncharacterized protein n=1 Tax=Cacopsylla melanoneura TaxID=428564 RepID=A0A8D9F8T0_9HEMI